MKVELPYLVQDQLTAARKRMKAVESFRLEGEEHFLDGPICPRVAVVDFDDTTGELLPGPAFEPPTGGRKLGRYALNDPPRPRDRAFHSVSVFATVLKTMRAFESDDVLGRRLTWGFDGPQLLVVPRGGKWANAFYERESRSLQFFYFVPKRRKRPVFTCLSHDIVAHEAGHAILDGIAPDLYHAVTPQSLGLHEAIADLTALIMSLESATLRQTVLTQTKGRIDGPTALSAVAEEFGHALGGGRAYLRSLWNDKTLDPDDQTKDEAGDANLVDRNDPHDVSQVLSGALYRVLVNAHRLMKRKELRVNPGLSDFSVSGKALATAAAILRRFAFRALDYLPPGEVSFADYGRAVVAADRRANPDNSQHRRVLERELVKRHVVKNASELRGHPPKMPPLDAAALDAIISSDWAAYEFANANRRLLRIPKDVPFRVLPRLDVQKRTYRGRGRVKFRECIFKVSWERQEPNNIDGDLPAHRAVTAGTTLVIDRETGVATALLTADASARQRSDRSGFLRRAIEMELLGDNLRDGRAGDSSQPLSARISGGVLRIRGGARSLNLIEKGW